MRVALPLPLPLALAVAVAQSFGLFTTCGVLNVPPFRWHSAAFSLLAHKPFNLKANPLIGAAWLTVVQSGAAPPEEQLNQLKSCARQHLKVICNVAYA